MLDKHLLVKTYPLADNANIVFFKDLRITVLSDRLFRVEKNKKGEFNDYATQSVWYRNMPKQNYSLKQTKTYVEITTERVTLHVASRLESCYVLIDGKKVPVSNEGNLRGTTRTLDCYDGDIYIKDNSKLELGMGVCSRTGVAVIDDTASLRVLDSGKLECASSDEFDVYVFAYGKNYRDAVKALYMITGATPMLPRYALGNWWSRYYQYTDEEYLYLMDKFEDKGFPLTVATIDMDWHYSDYVKEQKELEKNGKLSEDRGTLGTGRNLGWTGYSWNKDLFPDYKQFLKRLKDKNLKITLNLHPADGVRFFEDMYEEMAEAMGVDPKTEAQIKFDIANDDFVNNYFKILHHPYERDGVDFWWIDWQQGTTTAMTGLDPLWALNHYHYLDNGRDGKHPLILSRYAGIGSHRYPMGFSGDTVMSWATLKYIPYFTSNSTNAGYTWWSHDIGGHYKGVKEDELYLRFLQFGVFNPINRLHSTNDISITKEPWAYENGTGELMREMLIFRHRMIPFLHSANWRTHNDGLGLVEPMYYAYPEIEDSYNAPDQYLFGENFVVAPVTSRSEAKGLTRVKIWLPEGTWTDIFTGDVYRAEKGGRWINAVRALDSIPVLAKAGSVLPLSLDSGNGTENPKHLEAEIYSGCGSYTLYEDNEFGTAAFTTFENSFEEGVQTTRVSFKGDFSVLPENRKLTITFKNITVNTSVDAIVGLNQKPFANVAVLKNGKAVDFKVSKYSTVSVTLDELDYSAEYEVRVESTPISELSMAKRNVLLKLLKTQSTLAARNAVQGAVRKAASIELLKGAVLISDLDPIDKERLAETL
jgi:alpha-glucosidase (family GH31 glycosyl hydrolase)